MVLRVAGQCKKVQLLSMEDFSLRLTKGTNTFLLSNTDLEVKKSTVSC